jgi:hypothetical protein
MNETFTVKLPKEQIPEIMASLERVKMYRVDVGEYDIVREAEIKLVAEDG